MFGSLVRAGLGAAALLTLPFGLPTTRTMDIAPPTAFLLLGKQGPPSEDDKERARVRIGMSREQQAQLEAIFEGSRQEMHDLSTRMRDSYRKLNEVYETYDVDKQAAYAAIRQVMGVRKRLLLLRTENEIKMRRVLTRDQFERFRALLKEEGARRRGDRRRSPGPPGP
ncbi:MAG: periplasmic heavy metal sensor [Chthonomonadales bacterium]|nr:periplasmic heavy metal sensor [Chthonomonadales bacterium]